MKLFLVLSFCLSFQLVRSDTPANCTHDNLIGTWHFYLSEGGHDRTLDCSNPGPVAHVIPISLSGDNKAVMNVDGAVGTFNLVYNQGFEVEIAYRKLFAFFEYQSTSAKKSVYWCNRTMYGWSHDVLGNDWACFIAVKQPTSDLDVFPSWNGIVVENPESKFENMLNQKYKVDETFATKINQAQSSWKAEAYPNLKQLTNLQVLKRSGFGNGPIVRPKKKTDEYSLLMKSYLESKLPQAFDWRDISGINYVSPIRNQGSCGSCYAFASMAMLEARIRIETNNTQQPVFSPQEVVSCSQYAQGCEGGFPFLIAGKYAQDFGVVEEHCYPYQGKDTDTCEPALMNCKRHYVAKYEYVGGYYGACTEQKMMEDLIAYGPLAVAIEVYSDFQLYKSGIYHHVESVEDPAVNESGFNPFELTNHAVLVVGYGSDPKTGEKYWIVKNSWGEEWGINGYVYVKKGVDEIAIESLAQQSWPIPDLQ